MSTVLNPEVMAKVRGSLVEWRVVEMVKFRVVGKVEGHW